MTERLARLRGPFLLVLLVVVTLRIALALTRFVLAVRTASTAEQVTSAGVAAAAVALDPLSTVVLAVLVGSCLLWSPVGSARAYRSWAVVVVGLGLWMSLVASLAWLLVRPAGSSTVLDAGRLLLPLVLPALVLMALGPVGLGRLSRRATGPASLTEGTAAAALEPPRPVSESEPESDPAQEPVWQPDQASGAAWMKAGDAAAGAAASGWGTAGDSAGWTPPGGDSPTAAHPSPVPSWVPSSQDPPAQNPPAQDPPAQNPPTQDPQTHNPQSPFAARRDRSDANVADRYRPRNPPGPG